MRHPVFFRFVGVVALLLVFPCSPSAFSCPPGSWPCASVCRRLPLRRPNATPPQPAPPLVLLCPPLCFLVSRARRRLCRPPRGVRVSRPVASCSALTLVASVPCGCSAPLGRLSVPPVVPPPPQVLCFAGFVALPLVFLCSLPAYPWFRAASPLDPPPHVFPGCRRPAARFPVSSCCCLVFSVPLALAPVLLGLFFWTGVYPRKNSRPLFDGFWCIVAR